jgi:pyruvate dehydrogenase E2 component (dihydrolipoamide acetyltransferase)
MGLEVSEGTVMSVLVEVGARVAEGETLIEVETDKAIAEVAASRDGVVTAIEVAEGDTVPVGAVLVRIGDSADEVGESAAAPVAVSAPAAAAPAETSPATPAPPRSANGVGGGRRRAAPIARRAAREAGISLEEVIGTGPAGRITLGDVEQVLAERGTPAPAAPTPAGEERFETLSATRQSIARRLTESQKVPAYTLSRDLDVAWLLAEKRRLSEAGPVKIGVLDLFAQALAETLVRHPLLAASFVAGAEGQPAQLRHPATIDVGIAVATERGLLVPVLRDVAVKPLAELAIERARLVETTRSGRLGIAEMGGAATTISSLGTFGVDAFTAMLNPGESSILALGRSVDRVVPRDRGLAVVPTIAATFTFDHRVVDGAAGAAALVELAELLEGGMEWRS